jgi:hypothetical protein
MPSTGARRDRSDEQGSSSVPAQGCAEHTSPAGDYGIVTDEQLIKGLSSVCPRNTSALASAYAFLNFVLSHPHSDLMFDGDCRRKFDFSSESVRAHWAFLWPSTVYSHD